MPLPSVFWSGGALLSEVMYFESDFYSMGIKFVQLTVPLKPKLLENEPMMYYHNHKVFIIGQL